MTAGRPCRWGMAAGQGLGVWSRHRLCTITPARDCNSPRPRSSDHARCRQATRRRPQDPLRYGPPRPPDGRGRHRCPGHDLEAQRAIPARRPSRLLLRVHGCDGPEPLSAGSGLSQGRSAEGGIFRPSHGGLPEGERSVLGDGIADQLVGVDRCDAEGDRLYPQVGDQDRPDRCRAGVPAGRFRHRAAQCLRRQRDRGRIVRAGAARAR